MIFTKVQTDDKASILQRIAAGDQSAVQECLDRYGNLVWFIAKKFTDSREDAEDAVQEIFFDVWRNASRFEAEKSSEVTFISMISRRRLIDRLRKKARQPQLAPLESAMCGVIGKGKRKDEGEQMEIALDAKRISRIINRFRPAQRQVINLSIYGGMSHSEIAARTGMPIGTVKTYIRRGFERVRKSFAVGENEHSASPAI